MEITAEEVAAVPVTMEVAAEEAAALAGVRAVPLREPILKPELAIQTAPVRIARATTTASSVRQNVSVEHFCNRSWSRQSKEAEFNSNASRDREA